MTAVKGEADVGGYILAGGGSTRFGFDKALAELDGQPMLERMCRLIEEVADGASVVVPTGRYADSGRRMVNDHWPGEGPLGGIITALMDAQARNQQDRWCLIVGCDMPFLTRDWLSYLVDRALASSAGVVAPRSAMGLEPLCACWHTRTTGKLQYALEDGVRKVTEAMKRIEAEVVDEAAWKRFDSAGRLFWNMNTQADYEEAQRILKTARP
ncbi:MAG TPA: molybdenum cofactor guanylyltransferase [Candidatus Angelobacter sp.]|nr:molybdenum cofactor guanylyltransferase [Candidatus Angelobacter sp.]